MRKAVEQVNEKLDQRYYDPKLVMALAIEYLKTCIAEGKVTVPDAMRSRLRPEIHVYVKGKEDHFVVREHGILQWRNSNRERFFMDCGETLLSYANILTETALAMTYNGFKPVLTTSSFANFIKTITKGGDE